ncbi:MAG: hypothetical protein IJW00_01550 [Clostridia bacterium]|nr:hypothetical protein [Clostridia bacterium]
MAFEVLDDVDADYQGTLTFSDLMDEIERDTQAHTGDDRDVNGRSSDDILDNFLSSHLDDDTKAALRRVFDPQDAANREDDDLEDMDQLNFFIDQGEEAEVMMSSEAEEIMEAQSSEIDMLKPQRHWYDPLQLTLDSIESSGKRGGSRTANDAVKPSSALDRSSEPVSKVQTSEKERLQGYAVTEDGELKDKDTALYLHLGYESELKKVEETEHITRVSNSCDREEYHRKDKGSIRNTPPVVYDGEEYVSAEQTCEQERAYAGANILCKLRLWMSLAFALVGMAFDVFPDFAPVMGDKMELLSDSFAYPLAALLWLVLGCLPSITYLAKGIRSLFELKPVAYAMPAAAFLVTLAGTVAACFLAGQGIRLYIGAFLLFLFFACLGDCFRTASERLCFRAVSSGKSKYVVAPETHENGNDDASAYARTFRVRKVERLADYFLQVTKYDSNTRAVGLSACVALVGALVVAGVVVVMGRGAWTQGLSAFVGTYLAVLPAAYLPALTLPLLLVNRTIGRHGCAVLTPEASLQYAPGKHAENETMRLYFQANDVMKATQMKAVTMVGDTEAGEYRLIANRLFALLGFALYDEEYPIREDELKGIHLEIAEADKHTLRLYMVDRRLDMACEVLLGTYDALNRRGIKLPRVSMESMYKRTEDSRVLYLAFDRKFRLAYAVKYRPRRSFAQAVSTLGPMGYSMSVISYDPILTPDLLTPLATDAVPRIHLIRPDYVDEERDSRSGSILATGRAVDVTYPLVACRRIKTVAGRTRVLAWICSLLAIVGFGLLLGLGIMTHVSSLILGLWHFLWAGTICLCVKTTLRSSRLSMTGKDQNYKTSSEK